MLARRLALGMAILLGASYACVESTSTLSPPGETADTGTSGPSGSSGAGQSFEKRALLAHIANDIVLSTYREFVTLAGALEKATGAYAGSLSTANREAAQDAWRAAMRLWQRAEVMQIGPAGLVGTPGGKGLRDEIYSWDYVNPCAVDQKIVDRMYADLSVFRNQLITVRGLYAMEYLLFHSGTSNACAPQNIINASGSWQRIVGELDQRRADYAHALAMLIVERATELRDLWEPSGGNFAGTLSQPGADPYPNEQAALNAVTAAMFYLESFSKEMKLATPAGLSDMCDYPICPGVVESPYAGYSKQAIRENLLAFQILFLGAPPGQDAVGFDDWLLALGKGDLALRMSGNIQGAIGAIDAIEEDDLVDALASDPESVRAAHDAIKKVTDDLKSEFVSVLDLEIPKQVQGDND